MTRRVIDIVNFARNRCGLTDMSLAEFDSGTVQREHIETRATFRKLYADLISFRKEETRRTFTFSTSDSVNGYDMGVDLRFFPDLVLYVQSGPNDVEPYAIRYIPETELRDRYPNYDDIPIGKPFEFALVSTAVANEKRVFFDNVPDGEYVILGYQNVPPREITGNDTTDCNDSGDDVLEDQIAAFIRQNQGHADAPEWALQAEASLTRYLGERYKLEDYRMAPFVRRL